MIEGRTERRSVANDSETGPSHVVVSAMNDDAHVIVPTLNDDEVGPIETRVVGR